MEKDAILSLTGLKCTGEEKNKRAAGLLMGYPAWALAPRKGRLNLVLTTQAIDAKAVKQLRKKLRADEVLGKSVDLSTLEVFNQAQPNFLLNWLQPGGNDQAPDGTAFVVTLTLKDPAEAERLFRRLLSLLEPALQEIEGGAPQTLCPFCGRDQGDTMVPYNSAMRQVHKACLNRVEQESQESFADRKENAGYLQGILGGLVGGIVGAIPPFVALHFFDYFVWVLFATIPVGISFGWNLLKGKRGKATIVFTILYTLVVALAVDVMDTWLIMRSMFNNVVFMDIIDMYLDPFWLREIFMRTTLLSLAGGAVGIFGAARFVFKTDKGEQKTIGRIIAQAVTLDGVENSFEPVAPVASVTVDREEE